MKKAPFSKTPFGKDWTAQALRHPFASIGLAVSAVCLLLIFTVDVPIALWAGNSQSEASKQFFEAVTDIGKAGVYVYTGLGVLILARLLFLQAVPNRIAYLYRRVADMALYLLVTMALSGIVIHTLKFSLGRLRPKHLLNGGDHGFFYYGGEWTNNSFPSGHSQTIFNVAMVMTMLFPKSGYLLLPLAGGIALSRVMVSAHYPSDVLMGSFIGLALAVLVYKRWFMRLKDPIYPQDGPPSDGADRSPMT